MTFQSSVQESIFLQSVTPTFMIGQRTFHGFPAHFLCLSVCRTPFCVNPEALTHSWDTGSLNVPPYTQQNE